MKKKYKTIIYKTLILGVMFTASSCKKFVELGAPPTQILFADAFKTDAAAQSVVLGLYSNNVTTSIIGNFTFPTGISADDLQYNAAETSLLEFSNNAITTTNSTNANSLWANSYSLIKNTNNAISGIDASTSLTPSLKNQLLGEAKFLRALVYFYLVNLYGNIPLPLKDDYSAFENSVLPRTSAAQVYAQIIKDLTDVQASLPTAYVGTFRGRINKYAATALLARVYLYQKDYANAELQATQVIGSSVYSLPSPELAFINNSNEIIWQIGNATGVSLFGSNYVTVAATAIPAFSLPEATYQSFEGISDLRRSNWVAPKTVSGKIFYGINKFKLSSGTGNEYNVVLRLAEQYLIRSEARAQQNNLSGAKSDLDVIRFRAGLAAINPGFNQTQMLNAVEQERKVELFGEWGHRWLDLKRTNRADAVLGSLRPTTWKPTSVLFPIPQAQIVINNTLIQNPGYN